MNKNIRIEIDICQECEDKPIMLTAYNRKTNKPIGSTDMRQEEYEDLEDKIAELEFMAKMNVLKGL
jgi:hypothetical protein